MKIVIWNLLLLAGIVRAEDYSFNYGSYTKYNTCFRIKIQDESDDDGNSYFYNGAYRSQYMTYASFFSCENSCQQCTTDKGYIAELGDFLQANVEYVQNYCNSCANSCRRQLEDGGYYGGASVDCNVCKSYCKNNNNGNDETQYLDCVAAYADDDGLQLYAGPTCGDQGELVIGIFYDNECSIRKSASSSFGDQFGYNTFNAIQNMCVDCKFDDTCNEITNGAYQCANGVEVNNMQDDMRVCKNYDKVMKEWTYAKAKKSSPLPAIIFTILLLGSFCFLAYAYYVRHAKSPAISKSELAGQDQPHKREAVSADYAVMT